MGKAITDAMTAEEFFEWCHRPENRDRHYELERGRVVEVPFLGEMVEVVGANADSLLIAWASRQRDVFLCSKQDVIWERNPDTVLKPSVVCLAGTRLLVEESSAGSFLELFQRFTDDQVLGDPRDDTTTISPLIHRDHLERVAGFVDRARAAGDEVVRGGRVSENLGGLWYEPTLVLPRSNESEIVQREVFGPVLTFQTFRDEDEAVALANSTRYGLSGIVYTGSQSRAERVGRAIRAGTVWVNTFLVRDLTAPFGGIGISGIGREGGDHALDFYSDLETLQVQAGSTAK